MRNITLVNILLQPLAEIGVYDLDNVKSLKERIASTLSTLPNFLYFPNGIEFNNTNNITVIDLTRVIGTNSNFYDIIEFLFDNGYFKTEDEVGLELFQIIDYFIRNNQDLIKNRELEEKNKDDKSYYKYMFVSDIINRIYCDIFRSFVLLDKNGVLPKEYSIKMIEIKNDLQSASKSVLDFENFSPDNIKILYKFFYSNATFIAKLFRIYFNIDIFEIYDMKSGDKSFQEAVVKNAKRSKVDTDKFATFDLEVGTPYTDIDIEGTDYTVKIENTADIGGTDMSILEVFNYIITNNNTPYAISNNYFKLLKDFIPLKSWNVYATILTDSILLKVNNKDESVEYIKTDNDNYTDVIVSVVSEEEKSYITLVFNVKNKPKHVVKDVFLERILNSFDSKYLNSVVVSTNINNVSGSFSFTKVFINNMYVINDFIINDARFSRVISINEKKATKDRTNLYIKFFSEKSGEINADLTDQIVDKEMDIPLCISQKDTGRDEIKQLPNGAKYLRVKIRQSQGLDSIKYFQDIMSKLFTIYENEYNKIVKVYSEFIPNFESFKTIDESKVKMEDSKRQLKDLLPDIFLPKYSKRCEPVRQPKIINIENLRDDQRASMFLFPKKQKEDDVECPFLCDNPTYPHPGLITNKLSNKDKYPLIPCCFEASQDKPNSKFREYYFEEKKDTTNKSVVSRVIITDKFVYNGTRGKLPQNINNIFNINSENILNYNYYRRGMIDSKHSFLNCVLDALDVDVVDKYGVSSPFSSLSNDDKNKALIQIRNELSQNDIWATACKQEMYNYTINDIKNKIGNPDIYFDPKMFIHLLELKYDCNIYLFTRDSSNDDGYMTHPRFNTAYYKVNNGYNSIFIYEHMGSPLDKKDYPQCELIVQESKIENFGPVISSFQNNSNITQSVKKLYKKLLESYKVTLEKGYKNVSTVKNINYNFIGNLHEDITPLSQTIDSYGKTRMIKFKFEDNSGYKKEEYKAEQIIVSLLTEPLQPSNLPEDNTDISLSINKISLKVALDFRLKMGIKLLYQVSELNSSSENVVINEIVGKLGDIIVTIPINNSKPLRNFGTNIIPIVRKNINYLKHNVSLSDRYNRCKKNAKYLQQYILWLYSKYVNEELPINSVLDDENNIKSFYDNKTIIITDYEYGYVNKYFNMRSGLFQNGKLVLQSDIMRTKLIYCLLLQILRDESSVRNFYKRQSIEDFFEDETDFTYYDSQIVLKGESLLNQRNYNITNKLSIHDSYYKGGNKEEIKGDKGEDKGEDKVKEDEDEESVSGENMEVTNSEENSIYFFKNDIIDQNVYLAQNTDTISKALKIAYIWNIQSYNCGYNCSEDIENSDLSFELYDVENSKDITRYQVMGVENDYDIKILSHKIVDEIQVTTLLK